MHIYASPDLLGHNPTQEEHKTSEKQESWKLS